jgi:pimeloyl-ACP methyl ester carboxylesterase
MTASRRPRLAMPAPFRRSPARQLALAASVIAVAAVGPSSAAAAPAPTLSWQPCADPAQQGLQCATARVPRSYEHPRRSTIQLGVIRHRATDPSRRVGTLFFNPGGPGASIASFPQVVDHFFPASLKARFDIVTWDPRGTGQSTPVRCFDSREDEKRFLGRLGEPTESFPVGKAQQDEWTGTYRRFGRRCEKRNGGLLRHVSTAESARDLNLLRRAVGDRRLSYWGISYGTFLGATYANLFPDRVRALVLDGDINPSAWVHTQKQANAGAFLGTWLRQRSDRGAAKTLDKFLGLCGRAGTDRCAFSAGSAADTRAKFATLLQRLRDRPESADITYAELVSATVNRLYAYNAWSSLASLLQGVWTTGKWGEPLPSPSGAIEEQLAIFCSETPNPGASVFQPLDRFARDRGGAVGPYWTWASEPCASWPATAAERYTGPWDRRTANPVLVIGNTFDPATPYRGAKAMTRKLARARLLTVDGYGHTSLTNPSSCANDYASRYLIDQALPPKGARCEQDHQPFSTGP